MAIENGFEIVDFYDLKLKEYEDTLAENEFWDEDEWGCTREEYKSELLGSLKRGEQLVAVNYSGSAEEAVLPEGVTGMSENLFTRNKTVKKVYLPNSLRSVSAGAFSGCTALEEVIIGKNVRSIGAHAFKGCAALKSIALPFVHTVWEHAFEDCAALEDVKLGEQLKVIKWDAFANCKSLKILELPEALEEISLRAFRGCDLRSVYIPKNVYLLANAVFSGNPNLKRIDVDPDNTHLYSRDNCVFSAINKALICAVGDYSVPDDGSFARIGDYAFGGNEDITDIVIPEGVTSVDSCAFSGCKNLRRVTFPSSLEYICALAFDGCASLEEVIIPSGVKKIERFAFGSSGLRYVILKRGVGELGDNAFFKCEALEEVYLSSTVTVGEYADPFFRCKDSLTIYIEKSTEERREQLLNRLKKFRVEFIDSSDIFD